MLAFPALLMPISRDLGLPVSEVLKISFWMYLLYGIPSMGWGWISDVWGHRWAMGCGILIAGTGAFAVWILGAVEKSYGLDRAMATISLLVLLVIVSTLVFLALSRKHDLRH